MSEKEVTEKQIDQKLEEVMELIDEKIDEDLPQIIRLLAKLVYNLRFDLNDLKVELLKVLKEDDDCEVNHKPEEEDGRFYT